MKDMQVLNVESFPPKPEEGKKSETMTVAVTTPFAYGHRQVRGIVHVDTGGKAKRYVDGEAVPGAWRYGDVSIMVSDNGRFVNMDCLDRVDGIDAGAELTDCDGNAMTADEVRDAIGLFASQECRKPHVMTKAEYARFMPRQDRQFDRLREAAEAAGEEFEAPSLDEWYRAYMEKVSRELQAGVPYTGFIKTVEEFDRRPESYGDGNPPFPEEEYGEAEDNTYENP